MTKDEAAAIIRKKWDDGDGCRSCGWRSALYEREPLEDFIDDEDLKNGFVDLVCLSDDDEDGRHRGERFWFTNESGESHAD